MSITRFSFANLGIAADEVVSFPTRTSDFPPSNTLKANPSLVWRSDASDAQALDDHALAYRFNNPQNLSCFAFDVRKASSTAQFKVEMFDQLNPTAGDIVYSSGWLNKTGNYVYAFLDNVVNGVHVVNFVVSDPDQGRDYHEIERTWAGVHWSPEFGANSGATFRFVDSNGFSRGETGVSFVEPGVTWRESRLDFGLLTQADVQVLYGLLSKIGRTGDFLASVYSEDIFLESEHIGIWQMRNTMEVKHFSAELWSMSLNLVESRGDNPLGDYLNKIAALEQTIINLGG